MSSKTVKRQTFALDGGTYIYRITEASIRRYEEANAVPISAYMTMLQVVRALYHMTCMLPTRKARSIPVHRVGNTPSGAYVPSWSPPAGNSSELL